jgi:hypothetical protein
VTGLVVLVKVEEWEKYSDILNHFWILQTAVASLIENMIIFGSLKGGL